VHPLLSGAGPWHDSGNWRDAVSSADLAVRYLLPIAENEDALYGADFRTLAEINAAAAFIRDLPSQMRGNSYEQLIRLIKKSPSGPKRGVVRGLVGLAINPLGTTINIAANQLGKHLISDSDALIEFTSHVEALSTDSQLEYVWTHANDFPYEEAFDSELGRRAYWIAFLWDGRNWLSRFTPDFRLTPDVANQMLRMSRMDIQAIRNSPDRLAHIWCESPLFASDDVVAALTRQSERTKIARKLSKGKSIPEVEQAFDFYQRLREHRERHIHGYAIRMRWSGG
jgi:hypothetical protein